MTQRDRVSGWVLLLTRNVITDRKIIDSPERIFQQPYIRLVQHILSNHFGRLPSHATTSYSAHSAFVGRPRATARCCLCCCYSLVRRQGHHKQWPRISLKSVRNLIDALSANVIVSKMVQGLLFTSQTRLSIHSKGPEDTATST